MIWMTVMVMMISLMTFMKLMITVMLYIRSGSIWGSPQVLTAKYCFPFILSFLWSLLLFPLLSMSPYHSFLLYRLYSGVQVVMPTRNHENILISPLVIFRRCDCSIKKYLGMKWAGAFIGVGLHPLAVVHSSPPYMHYTSSMPYSVFNRRVTFVYMMNFWIVWCIFCYRWKVGENTLFKKVIIPTFMVGGPT